MNSGHHRRPVVRLRSAADAGIPVPFTKGQIMIMVFLALFIAIVVIAPLIYFRITNVVSHPGNESSLINGTFVGRVVASHEGLGKNYIPVDGQGQWVAMLQTKRQLLTTEDAVTGKLTLCDIRGIKSSVTFGLAFLSNGSVTLSPDVQTGPYEILFPSLTVQGEALRLDVSGSGSAENLAGILHRSSAASFDQLCGN
jgi:hypothetical protein